MNPAPLDRYIDAVLRHRWLVVALAVLVVLITGAGGRFIKTTNDYRIMFGENNPQLAAFNALENTFSTSDTALIAIAPREGSVFTKEALGAIEELTKAAWKTPHSSRVDSLTSYSHSRAEGDDLIVEPLVDDASALTDADVARVRKIALSATEIAGRLVSRDGRVGALAVTFVLPENLDAAVIEISDYLNAVLKKARAKHPDIAYHLTGDVIMNRAFADVTKDDLEILTPIVFVIIVAATILLLRSVLGALSIIIAFVFIIMNTMGVAGWLGTVFSPANSGRADHYYGGFRRPFGPHRLGHADGHGQWSGQERGDRGIVSRERLARVPDLDHDHDRILEPERLGFAAFSRPGQFRGVRRGVRLRLLHDASAGAAFHPAAARAAPPHRAARLLSTASALSSSNAARLCSGSSLF